MAGQQPIDIQRATLINQPLLAGQHGSDRTLIPAGQLIKQIKSACHMTGGYTPVKNGLLESYHRKKMGDAVWLFLKYCQFASRYVDNPNNTDKVCVLIFPKSIQTSLGIDKEMWHSYHQLLISEGYISSHFLADKGSYSVCIHKALLFKKNNIK